MQAHHAAPPATSMYRIVASLAVLALLGACGFKGPLYMPPPPPPPDASLTTPPESAGPSAAPEEAANPDAATPSAVQRQ